MQTEFNVLRRTAQELLSLLSMSMSQDKGSKLGESLLGTLLTEIPNSR